MLPCETTKEPGLLEHPAEAFAYYRHEGVPKVICEQKHMGSRAGVIVCQSEEAPRKRFGISGGEVGLCFNWKSLSVIGGMVLLGFYFQIHAGSIMGPQVVEFLRHLPGKLLILWGGASIHRCAVVRDYLASTDSQVTVERLPAYAPELNPVEYMWGRLKNREIAIWWPRRRFGT